MSGVLIVGAGLAGARCAEALRAGGYGGPVTIVGAEPVAPYERPALSKALLAGRREAGDLRLRPARAWAEREIELRLGEPVRRIDLHRRSARVGGRELTWDALVVATGAHARVLPGIAIRDAHVLRTLADALALREAIVPGSRLVVVGAGFVGAEVASTALELGAEVTIVETEPIPLARVAGAEVGLLLADRWREEGVSLHLGVRIDRFEPGKVVLAAGDVLPYDVLLLAIGAEPTSELLGGSGAIATDACGRTEHPGIYACGDVAAFAGRRVEHWTSASGQAAAVASTILGSPEPYHETPYFWSDQFGLRLQMVGTATGQAQIELEGDPLSFRARYVGQTGETLGVLLANRPGEVATARRELARAA
jgi:3-phenylpropionate/trans-cinnamate dioxygenase ferredoxin reductase component